jgi:hypothetical protein
MSTDSWLIIRPGSFKRRPIRQIQFHAGSAAAGTVGKASGPDVAKDMSVGRQKVVRLQLRSHGVFGAELRGEKTAQGTRLIRSRRVVPRFGRASCHYETTSIPAEGRRWRQAGRTLLARLKLLHGRRETSEFQHGWLSGAIARIVWLQRSRCCLHLACCNGYSRERLSFGRPLSFRVQYLVF